MKNNIIGFIVYFLVSLVFSPDVSIILLAMKENADRCHYYNGRWSYEDLCIGVVASFAGGLIKHIFKIALI